MILLICVILFLCCIIKSDYWPEPTIYLSTIIGVDKHKYIRRCPLRARTRGVRAGPRAGWSNVRFPRSNPEVHLCIMEHWCKLMKACKVAVFQWKAFCACCIQARQKLREKKLWENGKIFPKFFSRNFFPASGFDASRTEKCEARGENLSEMCLKPWYVYQICCF